MPNFVDLETIRYAMPAKCFRVPLWALAESASEGRRLDAELCAGLVQSIVATHTGLTDLIWRAFGWCYEHDCFYVVALHRSFQPVGEGQQIEAEWLYSNPPRQPGVSQ